MVATLVDAAPGEHSRSVEIVTLVYAVFVAGLCSIVYELLIATTVVYFLGDSVKYFSLTIGLYMAAMGLGAYLSKYVTGSLLRVLVAAEVALGLLGGFAVPVLYLAYSQTEAFLSVYVVLTLAVGLLIGLEVPFLTRLLETYESLRISIAHVLSLDYLGALVATVAFPLLLLPFLGVFRSGLVLGLINMTIGLVLLWCFSHALGPVARGAFKALSLLIAAAIVTALVLANQVLAAWNESVYDGRILHSERSLHQEIVLTRYRDDIRLYLNGSLQFSSLDEYRYHESLVHVPVAFMTDGRPLSVLVLGGGDGMAVRELLRHDRVRAVTLVDLDPAVLRLAQENVHVSRLNGHSLTADPRVRVVADDALVELEKRSRLYDLIVADLPDPHSTELARLYSREFYRLVADNLAPEGVFVTQATSPLYAREAFWSIHATVARVFEHTRPYHLLVPSFGDWGFVVASRRPLDPATATLPALETRYLDPRVFKGLFVFEKDLRTGEVEVSTLDRPVVLNYYLDGWRHWGR